MTCLDCEVLRLRAEVAESLLASVSGVTREALVRREQARFASAGEALRRIIELCETDFDGDEILSIRHAAAVALERLGVAP